MGSVLKYNCVIGRAVFAQEICQKFLKSFLFLAKIITEKEV